MVALKIVQAHVTDIGCKRRRNEDAVGFFEDSEHVGRYLLIVADGVGGNVAGDMASQVAVDTIQKKILCTEDPEVLGQAIGSAIQEANEEILRGGEDDPLRSGMATTCTAVVISGKHFCVGHVGDCRAYLLRDTKLTQLTHDHTLAAEYERLGKTVPIDRQDLANTLTRCLGLNEEVEVDVSEGPELLEDDVLILCSDGLTKVVTNHEIRQISEACMPESACQRMVELARERGGPDNITVQVVRLIRA